TCQNAADLLRHPEMSRWFRRELGWPEAEWSAGLADLLRFQTERLPRRIEQLVELLEVEAAADKRARKASEQPADCEPARFDNVRAIISRMLALCEPLLEARCEPAEWVEPLVAVMQTLYGDVEFDVSDDADAFVLGGLEAWQRGLMELRTLPSQICPPITAAEAILMSLGSMGEQLIAAPRHPHAVELLGWLELPLDDAPALVVTDFNDGQVPTASTSDLFLPDRLRSQLGLDDNSRRYARDAYALSVLTRTRQQLRLVFSRHDAQGNLRLPSRLLFAVADEQRVARCLRFFGDHETSADQQVSATTSDEIETDDAAIGTGSPRNSGQLRVPMPQLTTPVEVINVTDFKLYLACPYRFYLTRVLRLEPQDEPPDELDGAAFGNRMHEILEAFGVSPLRHSSDSAAISKFLLERLEESFQYHYGSQPAPAVVLQKTQLQHRLRVFAEEQSKWRRQGWRIIQTEGELKSVTVECQLGDERIKLRGRIDRIDENERTGEMAILDYKSSESGMNPREVHHPHRKQPTSADDWQDLQLPLYRKLATVLGLHSSTQLGFINVPRAAKNCRFRLADWTAAELATAEQAAEQVVRAIRAGIFWPPAEPSPLFAESLDRICHEGVFGRDGYLHEQHHHDQLHH
ncbi:MAG: PD-(D/E)XK nuclease family protein, partial [Planctomycetales bacterium]|nr:PD-(D/E)XK nuclease family protein [Planctomycetales bacterium]